MSAGNTERLERIHEQLFAGRALGPDLLAEDAEWVNPEDAVEGGTRRGFDAHGQVWTFREGRVTRMQWFNTHAEAVQIAGVRE